MTNSILNKKMPSLLGIAIIIVGITTTTFLVKSDQSTQIDAGSGSNPEKIQVSNISDSSFTVTYTTDEATIGSLNLGIDPENLEQKFLDDRDKENQKINNYNTHFITVTNLTPDSTYYYTINSGDNVTTNNGTPFIIKTGQKINTPILTQTSVAGNVINPDSTIPNDVIILFSASSSQVASTLLKQDGSYIIPLNNLRSVDLKNYSKIENDSAVNLNISSGVLNSQITLKGNQISPVPLVTLSNNYDFTENLNETSITSNSKGQKFPEFNSKIKPKTSPNPSL